MSRKPVASQMEFDRLVEVLEAVPFGSPGSTLREVHERVSAPYSPLTLVGILSTQADRGWIVAEGRGSNRRYRRVILHVREYLATRITIV